MNGPSRPDRRFRRRLLDQAEAFNLLDLLLHLPEPAPGPDDPRLRDAFRNDQSDRLHELPPDIGDRDRRRRETVTRLLRDGLVRTPGDFFHAAMVFQHGVLPEHNHLSFELARRAADRGHPLARWLAAAAMDRWLMRKGLPQKFGTQYVDDGTGWALYEVDPATTDQERAEWDVPPLAEAHRAVAEMNAPVSAAPRPERRGAPRPISHLDRLGRFGDGTAS